MSVESTENIVTSVVVTDSNREELERLYGKIPPADELSEAPRTTLLRKPGRGSQTDTAKQRSLDEVSGTWKR